LLTLSSKQCVSTRAKKAIGLRDETDQSLEIRVGDVADFVLCGREQAHSTGFRHRREITGLVYDAPHERMTVFNGVIVSR
jgi:hypothetical protein